MARRKFSRKGRRRGRGRKPGYKRLHALHAHEERVVLALIIERGQCDPKAWGAKEPYRWDVPMLQRVLKRLHRKGLVRIASRSAIYRVDLKRYVRSMVYVPRQELQKQEVA